MANDLFSKLGNAIRTTVGVGVGSIDVRLETHAFDPGDAVEGTLVLDLQDRTAADKLYVKLLATRETTVTRKDSSGNKSRSTQSETIYEFELQLDGEKAYPKGLTEHRFSLEIPRDVDRKLDISGSGIVNDVARVVSAVRDATRRPMQWQVIGVLHIPWKRNLEQKVGIQVRSS